MILGPPSLRVLWLVPHSSKMAAANLCSRKKEGEKVPNSWICPFCQENKSLPRTHPPSPTDFPLTSHWPGQHHPSCKAGQEVKCLALQLGCQHPVSYAWTVSHIVCAPIDFWFNAPTALGALGSKYEVTKKKKQAQKNHISLNPSSITYSVLKTN